MEWHDCPMTLLSELNGMGLEPYLGPQSQESGSGAKSSRPASICSTYIHVPVMTSICNLQYMLYKPDRTSVTTRYPMGPWARDTIPPCLLGSTNSKMREPVCS